MTITSLHLVSTFDAFRDAQYQADLQAGENVQPRINALVAVMRNSDIASFTAAAKQAAKDAPAHKTRISEARTIFGAMKFCKFEPTGAWRPTYEAARELLKDSGIRWNGAPIKTDDEKAVAKREALRREAEAELAAEGVIFDASNPDSVAAWGGKVQGKMLQIEDAKFRYAIEAERAKIGERVDSIMELGIDYAAELFQALAQAIADKNSALVNDVVELEEAA